MIEREVWEVTPSEARDEGAFEETALSLEDAWEAETSDQQSFELTGDGNGH